MVRARTPERNTPATTKDSGAAKRPAPGAPQAAAHEPPAETIASVEKCINCRFYDRRHARPLDGKAPLWGQCRRHAPLLNPNPITAKAYVVEGIWPLVRDDDWCGEWKIILQAEEWVPESNPARAEDLPPVASRERQPEADRADAALGDD